MFVAYLTTHLSQVIFFFYGSDPTHRIAPMKNAPAVLTRVVLSAIIIVEVFTSNGGRAKARFTA